MGEILHNFGNIRQLHLKDGVSYKTNLSEALAIIREILAQNSRVLKEPAPSVGVSALGETGATIAIEPWVSVPNYTTAQAELNQAIVERFRASHEVRLLGAP